MPPDCSSCRGSTVHEDGIRRWPLREQLLEKSRKSGGPQRVTRGTQLTECPPAVPRYRGPLEVLERRSVYLEGRYMCHEVVLAPRRRCPPAWFARAGPSRPRRHPGLRLPPRTTEAIRRTLSHWRRAVAGRTHRPGGPARLLAPAGRGESRAHREGSGCGSVSDASRRTAASTRAVANASGPRDRAPNRRPRWGTEESTPVRR